MDAITKDGGLCRRVSRPYKYIYPKITVTCGICQLHYLEMDAKVVATIDELLERLEHVEDMDMVRQLERLEAERAELSQEIENCKKALGRTTNLILETTETLSLLQTAAKVMEGKQAAAESKWLAYWGIMDRGKQRKEVIHKDAGS